MIIKYYLYSSEGCHLCEKAVDIIKQVIDMKCIQVIDIVEDKVTGKNLFDLYGVHIPVLARLSNNIELFWPFDVPQVVEFNK